MAGGKRLTGAALADFVAAYGFPHRPLGYVEFVQLWLNAERVRVRRVVDAIDAARVAAGTSEMPREWIALLAGSREEEALWVSEELRRSLDR